MTDEPIRGQVGIDYAYDDCKACGEPIRTMAFSGEDHCSENCRKWLIENGDNE